ncbi:MAG: Hpt domain-containing protein [Desulfomonilaceae bacterium]
MITIEELTEELGIDREDVLEFISVFLDYTENEDLPALTSGIRSGDHEEVRRRAHSIKGAALNLMLPEVASIAAQLEKNAAEGNLQDGPNLCASIVEKMKIIREELA